jgi:hypothetical protein
MRAPLPSNLLVNGSPVPTSAARERRDSVDGDEHASRRTPRFNVDPSVEGPAPVRSVGIGFFIRDFEISRVRSGSLRLNFFTDPSAELRLSLPASEQAPGRIQYEARTAIALLQMQWGRDARQLTELMLGRIEASAQQVRDAPFQPRGELSVGVSGTYRPTPGIELRGEAGGSIRPGGESADTQAGVSASANLEIEAHRNLVLFGRVQGRMVFEADGVRLEAETPFTAGLRFRF